MELIAQCYEYLFWGTLVALALGVVATLVYIIRSRLVVDRIIGINLIRSSFYDFMIPCIDIGYPITQIPCLQVCI